MSMSFAEIIAQEAKKAEKEQGGNSTPVEYPQTKHQRLFYQKDEKELLLQILPSRDIVSTFAEPTRKIFLNTVSSQNKTINTNFTLSPDPDSGSLLEQKIEEWGEKNMIPNLFGGQQRASRVYVANVVKIVQDQAGNYVQERDEHGNLVVRVHELRQSAYTGLLKKLQDKLINTSGTELSFMDINKPSPIKISKPAKGEMAYLVDVYTHIALPPLGEGWENQLEDLEAQVVPTEMLVNGDQWVQAFIDMKEGRKPNQGGKQEAVADNPYAQAIPDSPAPQAPQAPVAPQAPQAPVAPQPDTNIGTETTIDSYNQEPQTQAPVMPDAPQAPQAPVSAPQTPTAPQQPQAPQAPQAPVAPQAPQAPPEATQAPTQEVNANGMQDIDAMLDAELNN